MTIEEAIAHAQETANTRTDLCDECRKEHDQLAQWLTELKQFREENDTLKTEIMAVKSGSDILKICKLEEENKELKRLLRLALNDFEFIYDKHSCTGECECDTCCPYNMEKNRCLGKWKHSEEAIEAMKILEDNNV